MTSIASGGLDGLDIRLKAGVEGVGVVEFLIDVPVEQAVQLDSGTGTHLQAGELDGPGSDVSEPANNDLRS